MTKIEKNEIDDADDDMAIFDEMERNFYKVVSELVSDKSLDRFRQEYEKLHAALVNSHEQNKILVDKCKQLNNDILSNANKISSVLNLSQNDQRTISGLRHEFEKAWKMVEITQDKEAKSRDVIEALKTEVHNLSKHVEQGGALAFTQDISLQDIANSIEQLKKEIKSQTSQFDAIKDTTALHQRNTDKLRTLTAEMQGTEEELSRDINIVRDETMNLYMESNKLSSQLKEANNNLIEAKKSISENKRNIRSQRDYVHSLQTSLVETNKELRDTLDYQKEGQRAIKTQKKLFGDKQKLGQKLKSDIGKTQISIDSTADTKAETEDELDIINEENTKLANILSELKDARRTIGDEKKKLRVQLNSLRKEFIVTLSKFNKSESENIQTTSNMNAASKDLRKLNNEVILENQKTDMVTTQQKTITGEIMTVKSIAFNSKKALQLIEEETADYERKANATKGNIYQIKEDVKNQNLMNNELQLKLQNIAKNTKKQNLLIDQVQGERDMASIQLQIAAKNNAEIESEIEVVISNIRQLKEDIREADKKCIETHYKRKSLEDFLVKLGGEIKDIKGKIEEVDSQTVQIRNHIQRGKYLLSKAQIDISKNDHVLAEIEFSSKAIQRSTAAKIGETKSLYEKVRVVKSLIKKCEHAYKIKVNEVKKLSDDLDVLIERNTVLASQNRHGKALRSEIIRVEKSLIQEQGKCKALEEELEKPMSIHRWRILDGTNPEMVQLVKMNIDLRDKLMNEMSRLDRLKVVCEKVRERASRQEKHLKYTINGDYMEEFNFLTEVLHDKNRQLHSMQQQLRIQQDIVGDSKEQVNTVRTMVREEKTEFYGTKKKLIQMRARTAQGKRPRIINAPAQPIPRKTETRFVGGGFAVGIVPGRDMLNAGNQLNYETPKVNTSRIESELTPRINSISPRRREPRTNITHLPPGWNPKRPPITPYLPQLSEVQ